MLLASRSLFCFAAVASLSAVTGRHPHDSEDNHHHNRLSSDDKNQPSSSNHKLNSKSFWLEHIYDNAMKQQQQQEQEGYLRRAAGQPTNNNDNFIVNPFTIHLGEDTTGLSWKPQPDSSPSSLARSRRNPNNGETTNNEDPWMLLVHVLGDNLQGQLEQTMMEKAKSIAGDGQVWEELDCTSYSCYGYMHIKYFPQFDALNQVKSIQPVVREVQGKGLRGGLNNNNKNGEEGPEQHQEEGAHRDLQETFTGDLVNEALDAMFVQQVRDRFGLTGQGMRIGVLSDSFDTLGGYAEDIASGELPPDITVLQELPFGQGIDEGRAMMQLLFDLLPDATFSFWSAFVDPENFAEGIQQLADDGCNVIVDDISKYLHSSARL